ncbi:MAG: hypothetical protein F9K35_03600 [Burkholderiaceae bacterium]|nr:MAG: hypothetical protein F9K35_03600 [Burkholderiaceae bacterium]
MEEKTFFEYENVKVTNARFLVDGQTFAMSNITSVASAQDDPSRVGPILVMLFGFAMCASNLVAGLIVAAIGALWWWKQKSTYHVMLKTAGGETKALTSNQEDYVRKVIAALNDAIVHRG